MHCGEERCIKAGSSASFSFDGGGAVTADRLFLTGETNISPYWKTEPDYQMLYRRIDDSLRSDVANKDRFCLDFSGTYCQYPKIAFKKLTAPFSTPMFELNDCTDKWSFGISARAEGLSIRGYLRVCLEVRYLKDGTSRYSTVAEPDEVFVVDIPEGSYDWQAFARDIVIDSERVANVCYFVEGEDYEGEIYFEAPSFLSENGHNLLGQFLPHTEDRRGVNWMGQNLSRIEWIGLKVEINGRTVFDGEIFERCHRFSESEIALPDGVICKGENEITFSCTSNYRDAAGFVLREWGFITDRKSFVVSSPEIITAGRPFYVCVEGRKGDTVSLESEIIKPIGELVLKNDGLCALGFVCERPSCDIEMTLNGETICIARCVLRGDDGIVTGTGDMIYIPVDELHVNNFIKWYLSENIGNLMTIRPTYRWNGTRIFRPDLYRKTAELLDSMGIRYSHMLDGRELPGCDANPTEKDLDTEHFLGRQTHEFDGQFVYWGRIDLTDKLSEQAFYDLFLRMYKKHPDRMNLQYIPENVKCAGGKQYLFRTPNIPTDMQEAAEEFLKSLRTTRKGVLRHTGPATLFKYFYQAGYNWVGAELMYSPTELTVAALRGAAAVYGRRVGAHHAVQWSTTPHDTESRYRRYRLALYVSYIQGIDEINTEEGLWRLEEFYNFHHRFTPACENHTGVQKDFYRYILSHTRRGKFYTPIAFLNGRYDGWRCFGRAENTWGINELGFSDIERSWDLLTYFYPKSVLDCLYRHNCPDEEIGYYSGTPSGNVDILPIEAESFSSYRLLIAPGFNKAVEEDLEKMRKYVTEGGTLLLGWPQLSVTTDRRRAVACEHTYFDSKERSFVEDTYRSYPLSVCEDVEYDEVLVYTDSNKPLVILKNVGEGKACFVNAKEYAGTKAVDLAYRAVLDLLVPQVLAEESIYAEGDRNIQFAFFKREDGGRDIYFIATDWHKENPDGVGTLILGGEKYDIPVPWGQTVKISARGGVAVYPEKDENEVLFVDTDAGKARVQGIGQAKFIICKNGVSRSVTVDFSKQVVKDIEL